MTASSVRAALITGGGTGVGRATTLLLAQRGYDVAINYSRSAQEAEETAAAARQLGVRAVTLACDVADDGQVRPMISRCREAFGRLDVLVNNAGTTYFVDHRDLEGLTEPMWDRVLAVNLKGPYFVTRAAVELLRASRGAVVNVASVAGIAGSGSSIAYAASKGGLITMTKSLARALAPEVRVNAVCPGPILSRWLVGHEAMIEAALKATPLGKASTPEEVAAVIVFLACEATMVTGQAVVIDGGRTM